MAPAILWPSLMRATGSAGSMKPFYREPFLLTRTPFTVTCTAFIVSRNCNRNSTHASTNLSPNTPVMLKRTFRHLVSPILAGFWTYKATLCSRLVICPEGWIPNYAVHRRLFHTRIPHVHEETTKTENAQEPDWTERRVRCPSCHPAVVEGKGGPLHD